MMKPASGSCNMRCKYCFYCDEMKNREQENYGIMSLDTLDAILKTAITSASDSCSVAFQGGEPTLAGLDFFKKVIELEKKYNTNNIKITNALQSNGYGMTEEWAKFFAENDFLVGISVDGIKETHDAMRIANDGSGSFDRVLNATKLLDAAGAQYNILTVVNSITAPRIAEIYDFYKAQGWDWLQFIPCLDPIDAPAGEWALTPEIFGKFMCDLFDKWYPDYRRRGKPSIRAFDNYITMMLGYPPESCDMRGICGAQYVVEADGSVYPCDFYMLDEYRLGKFGVNSIEEMDKKRAELKFSERSALPNDDCLKCKYNRICRNGCCRWRGDNSKHLLCKGYIRFFDYALNRMGNIVERFK